MYRARGGPKRYVVIDDTEGLLSKRGMSGGGQGAGRLQLSSYATVESLQPALSTTRSSSGAGLIIPPIPRQSDILRPPRQAPAPGVPVAAWRRRAALLLGLLTLLLGGGWFLAAGPLEKAQEDRQARVEPNGDTLSLPAECVLGKLGVTRDVPFVRFDGHYPEQWPSGMRLPDGFFNQGQGKLSVEPARPGDRHYAKVERIEFKGVVHNRPDELVAFFRKTLSDAGLEITGDERSIEKELPGIGVDPGRITLTAKPQGSTATYPTFYVKVALLDDMGGWAYCTGHWIYGAFQLEEGEQMARAPKDAQVIDKQGKPVAGAGEDSRGPAALER